MSLIAVIWFAVLARAGHDLWAFVVIGIATTLLAVLTLGRAARLNQPLKLPLLPGFTLLLIALYLSKFHSYNLEATWIEFWGWVFAILLFYIFINKVDTLEKRDRFIHTTGLIVVPLAGYCLAEALLHRVWNVHGTLINSAVLAGFALFWPLFYASQARRQRVDLYWGLSSIIILMLSLQRTAMGLVLIGYLWWVWRSLRFQRAGKPSSRLVFAVLMLALGAVFYLRHVQAVSGATPWSSYTSVNRWHYWQSALAMWRLEPWTGVGLGSYETAYPHVHTANIENTRFAHSFILQWMAETGILGLCALVALGAGVLRLHRKSPGTSHDETRPILDLTIILILVYGSVSIGLNYWLIRCLLLLFIASTLVGQPMRTVVLSRLWAVCLGACLFLMIPFWINLWVASRLYVAGLVASDSEGNMAKAIHLHRQAISLEPYHADSYNQLARLFSEKYKQTKDPADLTMAQSYLQSAYRYKKDVRYLPKSS